MKLTINDTDFSSLNTIVYYPSLDNQTTPPSSIKFLPTWLYTTNPNSNWNYSLWGNVETVNELGSVYEVSSIEPPEDINWTEYYWRGLNIGYNQSNEGNDTIYLRSEYTIETDPNFFGITSEDVLSGITDSYIFDKWFIDPDPIQMDFFIEPPRESISSWTLENNYAEGDIVYYSSSLWKRTSVQGESNPEPGDGSEYWDLVLKENKIYTTNTGYFLIQRLDLGNDKYCFYWLPIDQEGNINIIISSFETGYYQLQTEEDSIKYSKYDTHESEQFYFIEDLIYGIFKYQNKYIGIDVDSYGTSGARYYAYPHPCYFTQDYLNISYNINDYRVTGSPRYHGSNENLVNIPNSTVLENFAEYNFNFLVEKYPFNRDLKIQRLDESSFDRISDEENWIENPEDTCYNVEALTTLENLIFPTNTEVDEESNSFIQYRDNFFGSTQIGERTLYLIDVPENTRKLEIYPETITPDVFESLSDYDWRLVNLENSEYKPCISIYLGPEFDWINTEEDYYYSKPNQEDQYYSLFYNTVSSKTYVRSVDELLCRNVIWIILTENNSGESFSISYGVVSKDKINPFRNKHEYTLRNDEYYATKDNMGIIKEKGKILLDDRSETILSTENVNSHPILTKKLRKFGLSYFQADHSYQPGEKVKYLGKTWKAAEIIPAYSQDIGENWDNLGLVYGGSFDTFSDVVFPEINWRTPTKDEWDYLINVRSASTVNGVSDARYTKAQVNNLNAFILLPDEFTLPDGISMININQDSVNFNLQSYTLEDWYKLEQAGCILLIRSGNRSGSSASGSSVLYWSSTRSSGNSGYRLDVRNDRATTTSIHYYYGIGVRCIYDNTIGTFSTSSTTKCTFSTGNLQFHCLNKKWRFAPNQYDFIGAENSNIAEDYDGWIDLFGFGTSGWNSGAVAYQPWSTSIDDSDYLSQDLTGDYENADWGVNISKNNLIPDPYYYFQIGLQNYYAYINGTWYSKNDPEDLYVPETGSQYWEEVYDIYSPYRVYRLGERVLFNSQVWESLCEDNLGNRPDISRQWILSDYTNNFQTTRISVLVNPGNAGSVAPGGNNLVIGADIPNIAFSTIPSLGFKLDTENPCNSDIDVPLDGGLYQIFSDGNIVLVDGGAWGVLEQTGKIIFNFIQSSAKITIQAVFENSFAPIDYSQSWSQAGENLYVQYSFPYDPQEYNFNMFPTSSDSETGIIPSLDDTQNKLAFRLVTLDNENNPTSPQDNQINRAECSVTDQYGVTSIRSYLDVQNNIVTDNVNYKKAIYTFYIGRVTVRINCVIGLEEFELEDNMIEYYIGETGYFRFYPRNQENTNPIKVNMYQSGNIEEGSVSGKYYTMTMPTVEGVPGINTEVPAGSTLYQDYFDSCSSQKLSQHYSFGDRTYYELEFTNIKKEIVIDIEYETQ